MENKLVITPSPHIRTPETTKAIMMDVLIALFPVVVVAVLLFGYQALVTMVVAVLAAMITEAVVLRKKDLISDGSAAVTGLLLAMTLPATVPWWMPAIGSVVAIILGKQMFGGLGNNAFNPALVGRAVLVVSWATHMAGDVWPVPKPFSPFADVVTAATPLEKEGAELLEVPLMDMFLGNIGGSLGETSALALLIGGFWLFFRGHIDWRVPGCFFATVFLMGAIFGGGIYENLVLTGVFHLLAGGVMIGALFMATDMVTSPVTGLGKVIFGVGCGLLTMIIRLWGNYPEGVMFAILLMNAVTPIIDRYTLPRKFGEVKE